MNRPVAVAITGGIGAGKSEALAAFRRHGAATVSSDEIVHHLLRRDEVRRAVIGPHVGDRGSFRRDLKFQMRRIKKALDEGDLSASSIC